ncbi:MAG TPA: DMT family transporter [Polyangiaceae bacterium]|nr:DMT family transporter [Polyangiaceae bacterium]
MRPTTKAHLQIHVCVFLWGFTAILGKLITLPALALVWWRIVIVVPALLVLPRVRRRLFSMPPRVALACAGVGVLVTLHWLAFYAAIKMANASVAATCLATAPIFLAVVEPWIAGRRFEARELLWGAAAIPGVALVVGGVPVRMRLGLAVGVLAAVLSALFGALNKRLVMSADPAGSDPLVVTLLELGAGVVLLPVLAHLPALSVAQAHGGAALPVPGVRDAALLLALAMGCTLLPFALSLAALRHITAYAAQLANNLEPVYSIVLAVLLLGEQREVGASFFAGVAIVLGVVLAYPALRRAPRG